MSKEYDKFKLVYEEYEKYSVAIEGYDILILKPNIAIRYIFDGIQAGGNFLGMDGFVRYDEFGHQPTMSVDIGPENFPKDKYNQFIKEVCWIIFSKLHDPLFRFEVVFDTPWLDQKYQE